MKIESLILTKRPNDKEHNFEECFEKKEHELEVKDGQILIKNVLLSLDPTQSMWMRDIPQYMPPVQIGEPMRSLVIGEIVESRADSHKVGQFVSVLGAWQTHTVVDAKAAGPPLPVDQGVPLEVFFCTTGMVAMTAYCGLTQAGGGVKATDTVVVSGAAGAVGSMVVQIARNLGAKRVVGIAGSEEKCKWLTEELGADAAINYKTEADMSKALRAACPDGVDLYFDNVAGPITDAVVLNMNNFGRIALCGAISSGYDGKPQAQYSYALLLMKRIRLTGFIVSDYAEHFPQAFGQLLGWTKEKKLKYRADTREGGLELAPVALKSLFDGSNTGKLMIKLH